MGTSAQQATFAAQKGKNWADPDHANFGQSGFINQDEYGQYQAANGGAPAPPPAAPAARVDGGGLQAAGGTPAPQTTGQALTGQSTVGQTPQQGQPATVAGSFQQALLNNLAPAPVTAADPSIAPAIQANQLGEQRSFERQRAMDAEKMAAQGFNNSGGADTHLLGLEQDRGAREGQFAANAIQGQTDKNRDAQLMMAQLAGGLLQGNDAQNLQRYGIDQDAQVRREGLATQGALGQGDLTLRGELGRGQLNLGLAGLLQNGQQFGQQLGANNAQFTAGLNQNALLGLLNGL